ncbi:MAG: hypothetical protein JJ896_02930 [Rhodothermales bacterium]|nr:hypothetical protein [Rhodothermales bacterium]MBO6778586.1 hypothetical protein [Rhodothermales bacterium]
MGKNKKIILGGSLLAAVLAILIPMEDGSLNTELSGMLLGGVAFLAIALFLFIPDEG